MSVALIGSAKRTCAHEWRDEVESALFSGKDLEHVERCRWCGADRYPDWRGTFRALEHRPLKRST